VDHGELALSATYPIDTVRSVSKSDPRRQTIRVPQWWLVELADKIGRERGSQARLVAEINERFGTTYDAPELSRCLSGARVLTALAEQLSDYLQIPRPIYLPITREEASRMHQQRELTEKIRIADRVLTRMVDPELEKMSEGVRAGATPSQSGTVRSPNGRGVRRER
jgi:hypothetical protein